MGRLFEGFDAPWPGLEWADTLTVEEAAEFGERRQNCPHLSGAGGCCQPGACGRIGRDVTLTDCYHCLAGKPDPDPPATPPPAASSAGPRR